MIAFISTVGMLFFVLLLGKSRKKFTASTYVLAALAAAVETGLVLLYLYNMSIPTP
ncbi:MAG TPA: hypothetical protein VI932_08940 [Bacteroidota bacterium]|nr:hypothetical protein [Bacteroidota bacterium]